MEDQRISRLAMAFQKAGKRKAARLLARLQTQEAFLACALLCRHADVAAAAAKKITSADMLYTVAVSSPHLNARREAVQNTDDVGLLKAVYGYGGSDAYIMASTRNWAYIRLKEIEEAAVDATAQESALMERVLGPEPSLAYESIIKKISSFDRLVRIASESPAWYVRREAFLRILPSQGDDSMYAGTPEQEEALALAMMREESMAVDVLFAQDIKTEALLRRMALAAKREDLRAGAICSLASADDAFLQEVVQNSNSSDIQAAALSKADSLPLLFSFIKDQSLDLHFRRACLKKMFTVEPSPRTACAQDILDSAVGVLLEDAKTGDGYDRDRILCIYGIIPPRLCARYGFSEEPCGGRGDNGCKYMLPHVHVHFGGYSYPLHF